MDSFFPEWPWPTQWDPGWTSVTRLNNHWLDYDSHTGKVKLFYSDNPGNRSLTLQLDDTWTTGWSIFHPYDVDPTNSISGYRDG